MSRTALLKGLRSLPSNGPGLHFARSLKSSIWWTFRVSSHFGRFGQRRTIVTILEEPPLDSTIPERPLTVALIQDRPLYGTVSTASTISTTQWSEMLQTTVTKEFGMSFASLDIGTTYDPYGGLEELQYDLSQLMTPQVLLIARGPLVSWWSQLYLEDFSLAGLILVDPLVPVTHGVASADKRDLFNYVTCQVGKHVNENPDYLHTITSLFFSSEELKNHRQLLLEPGIIPMMVISSHPLFDSEADRTAEHHRLDGETDKDDNMLFRPGAIPTLTIPTSNGVEDELSIVACFRESIGPWIESQVV
jgi:hypothetical protein